MVHRRRCHCRHCGGAIETGDPDVEGADAGVAGRVREHLLTLGDYVVHGWDLRPQHAVARPSAVGRPSAHCGRGTPGRALSQPGAARPRGLFLACVCFGGGALAQAAAEA